MTQISSSVEIDELFELPYAGVDNSFHTRFLPRHKILPKLDTISELASHDCGWVELKPERKFPLPKACFRGHASERSLAHWVFHRKECRVPPITLSKYKTAYILPQHLLYVPEQNVISADSFEELVTESDQVWFKDELAFIIDDEKYCTPRVSDIANWVEGNILDLASSVGKPVRYIEGPSLIVTAWWHHNVNHWLMDLFPRFWGMDYVQEADFRIILPAKHPPYITETLRLLNIDPSRIVTVHNGCVYKCDQLYNISRLASQYNYISPELIEFYDALQGRVERFKAAPYEKLYVSRRDSDKRVCENEAEFEEMLLKRGFEIISLTELPFEDRMRYFSGAKVVVSACGAGLAHCVLMQENSHLIVTGTAEMHFNSNMFVNIAAQKNQTVTILTGNNMEYRSKTEDRWFLNLDDAIRQVDAVLYEALSK